MELFKYGKHYYNLSAVIWIESRRQVRGLDIGRPINQPPDTYEVFVLHLSDGQRLELGERQSAEFRQIINGGGTHDLGKG